MAFNLPAGVYEIGYHIGDIAGGYHEHQSRSCIVTVGDDPRVKGEAYVALELDESGAERLLLSPDERALRWCSLSRAPDARYRPGDQDGPRCCSTLLRIVSTIASQVRVRAQLCRLVRSAFGVRDGSSAASIDVAPFFRRVSQGDEVSSSRRGRIGAAHRRTAARHVLAELQRINVLRVVVHPIRQHAHVEVLRIRRQLDGRLAAKQMDVG